MDSCSILGERESAQPLGKYFASTLAVYIGQDHNIYVKFLESTMIAGCYHVILDAGFWILDRIRNSFFVFSSIEHPVTSIASPQAMMGYFTPLVGLRQSFARYNQPNKINL